MKKNFWNGFEKQAGMLAQGLGKVMKGGRALSNKGLEMATNPKGGKVMEFLGKGMHHSGEFIRKNPAASAGIAGAGTVGAMMSGGNKDGR